MGTEGEPISSSMMFWYVPKTGGSGNSYILVEKIQQLLRDLFGTRECGAGLFCIEICISESAVEYTMKGGFNFLCGFFQFQGIAAKHRCGCHCCQRVCNSLACDIGC